MLTTFVWDAETKRGQWLHPEELTKRREELRTRATTLWIDLYDPTPEEERLVYESFFPVHPLTREDITKLRREPGVLPHFPKVEEFADYLFVIVNPLRLELIERIGTIREHVGLEDGQASTQLSAILTHTILITHHYEVVISVEEVQNFLRKHDGPAERGPDYLFHLILDAMVDQYAPVLDHFDHCIDAFEARVLEEPTKSRCQSLLQLKHDIVSLRKTLIYEREVLARLCRGEFSLIDTREMVYYRNVYDHLVRFTELIESSREMISDLMQTSLAATANRMNEIMKVLTMISTVVLPMTLVAGIYGMNFKHMPELEWAHGYPVALALMLLMGLGSYSLFRWKKWLD